VIALEVGTIAVLGYIVMRVFSAKDLGRLLAAEAGRCST